MQATLARIDVVNPRLNAIVSCVDEADLLEQAEAKDTMLAKGESMGWLHGIPVAIKDTANTAGIASTLGSPLLKDFIPKEDGLMVSRMRSAGCIVIGKTNVPEFGLGSNTYNTVFGSTGNAYDPTKSAGGSSGGAAVSIAARMLSVGDGSDFGGSLRNPAAWSNLFALRPSQGRVPLWPQLDIWFAQLATEGPMGRTVKDVAKLLSIQAGWDVRSPLSIAEDGHQFSGALQHDPKGIKIGWLGDLNGYLPMEAGILNVCEQGLKRFESMGCLVEPIRLGFSNERVWDCWLTLRKAFFESRLKQFTLQASTRDKNRALMKPEALWELDQGRTLTGSELMSASQTRTALYQQILQLFEKIDYLAIPTTQVWPFDVSKRWPTSIDGRAMDTYHRWMEIVILPTLAGLPTMNIPVGFNPQGLPAGMQLIGKPRGDWEVLQLAYAYEQAAQEVVNIAPNL
jgi:amidase